ncbi:MAG TPA: universal stress protein [Oscillatoriales cyanobacterium M59_W2019_021]|nr:MAG: universal stress protein [Cyanobacteria bacterium J055]HIK33354.1 universal stress protein [Oscillatoriales cyanobacterium M4454_W2019_049]HIK52398.1 universal stress protein [Oscillatoriales cyanobacterium M59_W2019_021]
MFDKILVALDRSPLADAVFDRALDIAKAKSAELMLLHVLSGEEDGSPLPIPPGMERLHWSPGSELTLESWRQQWATFEGECWEDLRSRTARANTAGVVAQFQQVAGSAGRTICEVARTWGADAIVLGTRGRSGVLELLLGSTSNYVVHRAPCTVLAVKSPSATPSLPK